MKILGAILTPPAKPGPSKKQPPQYSWECPKASWGHIKAGCGSWRPYTFQTSDSVEESRECHTVLLLGASITPRPYVLGDLQRWEEDYVCKLNW